MDFRILGPIEVERNGMVLQPGGPKQRALLAVLLLEANRTISTARLIELLWGEESPETADHALQVYVSNLRKLLEPGRASGAPYQVLISQPGGYSLKVDPEQLDVFRFDRLVQEGRRAMEDQDPGTAAEKLREALSLWRGAPLADLGDEPFAIKEVGRLNERRLRAIEDRIEAELALGLHADLVGELESLLAEHPLRERLCGQLMLALYRSGRQAEVSATYYQTRRRLVEELGMEPSPVLQKLLRDILKQEVSLSAVTRPPQGPPKTNLPLQLATFVGREPDRAALMRLLHERRLVTLTGTGGIGKSRLALEVATDVVTNYPDGVWLVELAPLADGNLVAPTVAVTLGLHDRAATSPEEPVIRFLEGKRALLLLDNCEHLIEGAARFSETVIGKCGSVEILATSRETLGIDAEAVYRVPPLPVEEPVSATGNWSAAVQLFIDRAQAANPSFKVDDNVAPVVAQICRELDGLPLAIELAAARVKAVSADEILRRLEDRFRLLTGGRRVAVPRQQTLRATIDWSYDLLSASEQVLFRRLSVFAGGLTLDAAEAICGDATADVLDGLSRLIDKSLVLSLEGPRGIERYELLETLRQYGHERLTESGEENEYRKRHAEFYLMLVERAEPQFRTREQGAWLARLKADIDNVRSALQWLETSAPADALRMSGTLGRFWLRGWLPEGRRWLTRSLTVSDDRGPTRLKALDAAAFLCIQQADWKMARMFIAEWKALATELDNPAQLGHVLNYEGIVDADQGDTESARAHLEQAIALLKRTDDVWSLANALNDLGYLGYVLNRDPEGSRLVEEALALARLTDDPWQLGLVLDSLATIRLDHGDIESASGLWKECLEHAEAIGDRWLLPTFLEGMARVALRQSLPARCLQLLTAARKIREATGAVDPRFWIEIIRSVEQEARGGLTPEEADTAVANGAALTPEQAVAEAKRESPHPALPQRGRVSV